MKRLLWNEFYPFLFCCSIFLHNLLSGVHHFLNLSLLYGTHVYFDRSCSGKLPDMFALFGFFFVSIIQ